MDGPPQRPVAVPEDATWVDEAREWRWGLVDAAGEKQGVHRSWRPDGSLREEVAFVDGKGVGPYRRFHPNGQLAGSGEFVDGNMQGMLRAFASDAPTPERLQSCCVPPNAWELQSDYHHGQVMAQRWYNREGQQILESGAPQPPRPPSVPADARYDEPSARWFVGDYTVGEGRAVHWRRWSQGGVLVEEEQVENDTYHGAWRRFRETDGALCIDVRYQRGLKHGPFRDDTIAAGVFAEPRAVTEEGTFERDLAAGLWRLRDAAGEVVIERDLGVAADDDALARSPALAVLADDAGVPAAAARALADRARTLRGQRRIGEAILATARSAALTGDAGGLRELLDAVTWPRAPSAAGELAASVIERAGDRLAPLVDALVRGGAPAPLFRALAAALKGGYRAALQLVDAGLLLAAGDSPGSFVTRSLVNVHLGAPAAAARDLEQLPAAWSEQRTQLLDYQRVIFPRYDFWPARVAVETIFEEYPEAPAQSLHAIREVVQKFATRLSQLRAALLDRLRQNGDGAGDPADGWLVPDLAALLPEGPVALGASTFQQSFVADGEPSLEASQALEDEAPSASAPDEPQVETIAIDERLQLDGATIPTLQRLARRDWAALAWLCWSCGLDRVSLPETLSPPAEFGRAAGMSIERTWRCRDKLTSGGLVAMTKGVPGFEWEGMEVDVMPRVLAEVMTEEHLEVRAMFLWLCDGTARSPWQSDLRDAD